MSGKQEKRKRREGGISITARRGNAEFARLVQQRREDLARDPEERTASRVAIALAALAFIVAMIVFALAG